MQSLVLHALPLLSLLCLLPSPLLAQTQTVMRELAAAPWPERSESSAYRNTFPQSILRSDGSRMLVPAQSVWVYGGIGPDDVGLSDVWVTTDGARTWAQVDVSAEWQVQDVKRSADCWQHASGRVYALTGSGANGRTARSVGSNDGVHWEMLNVDNGFPVRERPGCTVDSAGNVFIFGGSTASNIGNIATNDVWVSRDLGYTFTRALTRAPWPARISADTQTYSSPVFAKDVMYLANGDIGVAPQPESMSNDIWVSSDGSRSWFQLTAAAPYSGRKDAELTISKDGVLIVSGGDNGDGNLNDIWASLDGGYTWGACCTSCGWDIREDQMELLDKDGYYLMMAGDVPAYQSASNDVWISTFSFHDLAAVASNCKLSIPSAGVGLRCWPDENGGGCTTSQSSPSLSGAAIAGIIFAILGAGVVLYLLYRYQQQRQASSVAVNVPLTEDAKAQRQTQQQEHSQPFLKTDDQP